MTGRHVTDVGPYVSALMKKLVILSLSSVKMLLYKLQKQILEMRGKAQRAKLGPNFYQT